VPMKSPPPAVRKTVRRKTRVRSRRSSDNIANRLNAQQLAGGMGHPGAPPFAAGPGFAPARPFPVAGPGFFQPSPPPFWGPPPPRPVFWGPWGRPWGPWARPWGPWARPWGPWGRPWGAFWW
jgi:hypothetical protein